MYVHQSKKTRSQKKFSEDLSSVDNNIAYHFIFGDPNFGDFLMEYNWGQRVDSESTTRDMASPKLGLGGRRRQKIKVSQNDMKHMFEVKVLC